MDKTSRNRSKAACQFCRTRKLKCDNLQPECSACRAREIPCEYVTRTPAPRPSNAAIHALQAENERLRRLLDAQSESTADQSGQTTAEQVEGDEDSRPSTASQQRHEDRAAPSTPKRRRKNTTSSQIQINESHATLAEKTDSPFEAVYHDQNNEYEHDARASVYWEERRDVDESISLLDPTTKGILKSQLVAGAARQRQIEALPSSSKSYDYDGWEPELVIHLLNIHFNRQHHNLLLIYRPLFMRDFGSAGPYFSKLLLNAIMFAASKFSPRIDIRKEASRPSTAGWQFRQRFKNLLGEAMDESSITTIQALITVASSLFAVESAAKSTAWLYSGIAFRMIIDLGLNIDGIELLKRQKITVEDLECRRRVFWGAFVFDKIHSMYFGRPVTLQETNVRVPIEFLDDYEELEQWLPVEALNHITADYPAPSHPGGPSYSVTTFSALCRLSLVLGRIMNEVYSETVYNHSRHPINSHDQGSIKTMHTLDGHLQQWWAELPPEIQFEPWATEQPLSLQGTPTPTILSLHCLSHISIILLYRPYLTKGHLYSKPHAAKALLRCTTAAIRLAHIVRAYIHAFTVRRAPYFIAYSGYVAITILIRVSAYQENGSVPQKCLQSCLNILDQAERTNAGVRRASYAVSKLLFSVARRGPNPFPSSPTTPPWGEFLSDKFEIDPSAVPEVVKTFSLSSPDAATERSEIEPHALEPRTLDPSLQSHVHGPAPVELDNDSAAHLLASLRSTTPAVREASHSPMSHSYMDNAAPFPDIIFGLHGDDSCQPWPALENMFSVWGT